MIGVIHMGKQKSNKIKVKTGFLVNYRYEGNKTICEIVLKLIEMELAKTESGFLNEGTPE